MKNLTHSNLISGRLVASFLNYSQAQLLFRAKLWSNFRSICKKGLIKWH